MKTAKEKLADVGAAVPRLLFPKEGINLQKFAVIACDQYSAQEEYWDAVRDFIGSAPSSLQLMMPEAWLGKEPSHENAVPEHVRRYLADGTLREIGRGMMFLHRGTTTGVRRGLLLSLDLEQYDFAPDLLLADPGDRKNHSGAVARPGGNPFESAIGDASYHGAAGRSGKPPDGRAGSNSGR